MRCLKETPQNTIRAYAEATKNLKCPKETLKFTQWLANPSEEPSQVAEDEYKTFEDDTIVWQAADGHELKVISESFKENCSYVRLESRPKKHLVPIDDEKEEKVLQV